MWRKEQSGHFNLFSCCLYVQQGQFRQGIYWLAFQCWSVMDPAGIPRLCVVSSVPVKMFLHDLYYLEGVCVSVYVVTSFQSSQHMLISWCPFLVVPGTVLPSLADPCPYRASLDSGLACSALLSAIYSTQALSSWSKQGCCAPVTHSFVTMKANCPGMH